MGPRRRWGPVRGFGAFFPIAGALLSAACLAACGAESPEATPASAPGPSSGPVPGEPAAERPPNFLVILADDLGASDTSPYGNGHGLTPSLDRLAASGLTFETCWATPICSPSRVLLLTGRYGFRTGWFDLMGREHAPAPGSPGYDIGSHTTFADVLQGAGYATGLVGKWQLSGEPPELLHDAGFEEYRIWGQLRYLPPGTEHTGGWESKRAGKTAKYWHPAILENGAYVPTRAEDYGPDLFCDFAVDFIRRHRDEPFLLYYPMCLVHKPWAPTPDPRDPGGAAIPGTLASNLAYLDHLVGRLLDTLEEEGLREQTLVLFTGDNGTAGGGKNRLDVEGVRVPLIASQPGRIPQGARTASLADLSDIFPTLAELAGAPLPEGLTLDGRSFARTLTEPDHASREWIFSYLGTERLVRDAGWLLDSGGALWRRRREPVAGNAWRASPGTGAEERAARRRLEGLLEDLPGPSEAAPEGP